MQQLIFPFFLSKTLRITSEMDILEPIKGISRSVYE